MPFCQSRVAPTRWTASVAGALVIFAGTMSWSLLGAQAKTSNDAVYSAAQATRGQALYNEQCAFCHGDDMSGGSAPGLAGGEFLGFWNKTPLSDLLEKIVGTMPAGAPGSLTNAQGAEITAYILQVNKFPAGQMDLPDDPAALKAITLAEPTKVAATPVTPRQTAAAPAGKTVKDSVYSEAQATRGQALYNEQCAFCHGDDMSGGSAPGLAGADFLGFWDKTPLSDLVDKIVQTMPASAPGSLTAEQGADITAYVLQVNKFPAGQADLSADAAALKAIAIAK
ncbi:MAG: cytochrome c [Acidimicrobiia bacterium]|nr:cytochrome c [Acidimicrobiia bacterium]